MTAREALRLGTRGGAAVLGRDDIGSLEPGKCADFAVWRTDGLELGGADDLVAGLVFSAPHRVDRLVRRRRGGRPRRRARPRRRGRDRARPPGAGAKIRRMSVSLSTHVLDTGAGRPARGVRVELVRGDELVAARRDRRRRPHRRARRRTSSPARTALVFQPPSPFFTRVELEVELERRPLPRPAARLALRVRELPRQLTVDELAELFEGRTRLVERLAELEDPLERRRRGDRRADRGREGRGARRASGDRQRAGSPRARPPSRAPTTTRPCWPSSRDLNAGVRGEVRLPLRRLRRPPPEGARSSPVLRERLERTRDEELETALPRARRDREGPMAAAPERPVPRRLARPAVRWLHVIAGIVWIGTSFYFVALDNHLAPPKRREDADAGVARRVLGDPRRRLLPRRRSTASRRASCPSRCTGSSGRRTRRGCPASRCSSSSTTSTPTRT